MAERLSKELEGLTAEEKLGKLDTRIGELKKKRVSKAQTDRFRSILSEGGTGRFGGRATAEERSSAALSLKGSEKQNRKSQSEFATLQKERSRVASGEAARVESVQSSEAARLKRRRQGASGASSLLTRGRP